MITVCKLKAYGGKWNNKEQINIKVLKGKFWHPKSEKKYLRHNLREPKAKPQEFLPQRAHRRE